MAKWFLRPSGQFWKTTILSVAAGAAAGILGAIAVWSSLLAYRINLQSNVSLPGVSEKLPSTAERETARIIREELNASIVDVFLATSDPEARYVPEDAVGRGVVLTSDGWILIHRNAFDLKRKAAVRIGVGAFLKIPEKIIEDTETGALFIKIAGENLRAAIFGSSADLHPGDSLWIPNGEQALLKTSLVRRFDRDTLLVFSDRIVATMLLRDGSLLPRAGSPVIDSRGTVVGLFTTDKNGMHAMPVHYVSSLFPAVFNGTALNRPTLGVRGLSLSGSRTARERRERGFLIGTDGHTGVAAVERRSPADIAGLRAGDIITRFRDRTVNGQEDLSELLLAAKPGETVDLTVVRDGEERMVSVTLGTREVGKEY